MTKNTAGQVIGAELVSATDGSAFTGSVTCSVTGDGGTQATGSVSSGACTHEGNGYHTYAPAQAETNYDLVAFTFTGTGAIPVTVQVFTTGYAKSGSVVPANVTQFGSTNGTFSGGRPEVNTTHAAGTAWASGAITRSALAADTGLQSVRSATAQAGAAGTVTLDASASATTDFYKHCLILLTGGTGVGQVRLCTAYNGSTKVATITPSWATNPDSSSTFALLPHGLTNVQAFGGAVGTFTGGRPEVNTTHWGGTAIASALVRGNVIQWTGTNVATPATAGYPVVTQKVGTGTGEINLSSGAVPVASVAANAITATAIADGAMTAAKFAAGAFDAVWAVTARLLTAGTNIVLAKGTGVTGFNDLDAAGVRGAVGLASADLDTQLAATAQSADLATTDGKVDDILEDTGTTLPGLLATIAGYIDTEVATILARLGAWAGSGRNTVLGAMQALFRKDADATVPSDINADLGSGAGTADNTTDAVEAIRDRGDAAWTTGGSAPDAATVAAAVRIELATELARIDAAITTRGSSTDVSAIKTITDALTAAAAGKLAVSAGTILPGTVDTTGFSSTTTEFESDDITEATADHFIGRIVIFRSGALQYQATRITDYALSGGRGHFTVSTLTEAPSDDVTFVIL